MRGRCDFSCFGEGPQDGGQNHCRRGNPEADCSDGPGPHRGHHMWGPPQSHCHGPHRHGRHHHGPFGRHGHHHHGHHGYHGHHGPFGGHFGHWHFGHGPFGHGPSGHGPCGRPSRPHFNNGPHGPHRGPHHGPHHRPCCNDDQTPRHGKKNKPSCSKNGNAETVLVQRIVVEQPIRASSV